MAKVNKPRLRDLPRNVWAVSLTSFFMDISSEMVINVLPLFLANVLGVKTNIIGLIEGVAEATASLLKLFSGWLSDKLRARKWLAVAGYGLSALSKPFFYFATTWEAVAAVRWADRVGKGIRTAPRDALVADSIDEKRRGLAFGLHRAADTAGAMLGILIALLVVALAQSGSATLDESTFRTIVLVSLMPAVLAVLSLAVGAQDVPVTKQRRRAQIRFPLAGQAVHGLHAHRRHLHPGQLVRRLPGAARPGARAERPRHAGHAGHVQPGLQPGVRAGRLVVRPGRPASG